MVIIQQNITAFWIGTNLKGFSLTSEARKWLFIQNLDH